MAADPAQARARRIVGIALMAGAVAMVVVAVLIFTGVFPVDPSIRGIVAGALGVAALVDAMIGFRFLMNASTS